MDKEKSAFIENDLYAMITSPIEKYIKPQMTVQERVAAKQKVFLRIKELINGAQIYTELSKDEIIDLIQDILQKRKCIHEGATLQIQLVKEMLDEIKKKDKEDEKTI